MADMPEACDFQVPAVLRRDGLLLSVATSGASPALAAVLRARLEREIGPEYAMSNVSPVFSVYGGRNFFTEI